MPDETGFMVSLESLDEQDNPVMITQSEFMRRMKDMAQIGGGFGFYGDMPDSYNVVINSNHPLISRIAEDMNKKVGDEIEKINEKLKPIELNKSELDKANKDKKDEEIAQADKDRISELDKKISEFGQKREEVLDKFGKDNKIVRQLVDIALLSNNMLKGEDLSRFVKRSIELL